MATNAYGLDVDYLRKKLKRILRDMDHYTPEEMTTECERMAETARPKPKENDNG